MPIEKMRALSILVWVACLAPLLSGEFARWQFLLQTFVILPLWFNIDLSWSRSKHAFWRLYLYLTGGFLLGAWFLQVPLDRIIFFLILFCLVYEYYGEQRKRAPIRLIGLLSFLIVLSQFRYDDGLWLFAGIFLYLCALLVCLMSFHVTDHFEANLGKLLKTRSLALVIHAVAVFWIGFGVFLLMPRVEKGDFSVDASLTGDQISAFSDSVNLNDLGKLKLSRKHVMDIVPLNSELHTPYLKGKVLDTYRDGIWSTRLDYPFYRTKVEVEGERRFLFADQIDPNAHEYDMDIKPLYGNVLFFFNDLYSIDASFEHVRVWGPLTQIRLPAQIPTALRYRMAAGREGRFTGYMRDESVYLTIQKEMRDYLLAEALAVSGLPDLSDGEAYRDHPGATVQALLHHFQANFDYSLDINNFDVEDPLQNFLQNTRSGHCEFFATSMTLLLRSLDIPARMVTGFLVEELHPSGGFYYVTESNAHAWVEVYYEGAWHTVDPTPAMPPLVSTFSEAAIARLNRWWRSWIVTWDVSAQTDFFLAARESLARFADGMRDSRLQQTIILGAMLLLAAWYYRRHYRARLTPEAALPRVFQRVDQYLQKAFDIREPRETLFDYVQRLDLNAETKGELRGFVSDYQTLRFSDNKSRNLKQSIAKLRERGNNLLRALKSITRERKHS